MTENPASVPPEAVMRTIELPFKGSDAMYKDMFLEDGDEEEEEEGNSDY